jgi:Co/Zn/Cd efflux system component
MIVGIILIVVSLFTLGCAVKIFIDDNREYGTYEPLFILVILLGLIVSTMSIWFFILKFILNR